MPEEMHAVRVHEHGDPSVLRYESVARPEPAADELLVRVRGAGLNPVDAAARRGQFEYPLPWIPGWDLSGAVAAESHHARGKLVLEPDSSTGD